MAALPTIPGVRLTRLLARGGDSLVYLGEQPDFHAPVAVKVLPPRLGRDPARLALWRRELAVGLRVRHPHLVRVLGGGAFVPPYHIVMDLMPGPSLRDVLRGGPLPPADAVLAVRQAASALAALHAAGYVHADVKPDNLRRHAPGRSKLVDLGYAHRPGDDADLHAAGQVLGTANYLAPELCRRPPRDDFPADVFALGVTLFELLTGTLPYPTGTVAEVVRARRTEPPAKLPALGRPAGRLPALVARMLAAEPADRPAAAEVVRRLTEWQLTAA